VHLDLAIVDNLLPEVMRGFAAVPKRGAEVGGVLIGSFESGVIHVQHFELVACMYARGPSYLLASEDRSAFEQACRRWSAENNEASGKKVVGYFRSHTREGLELSAEDIELLDRYFPDPHQVALLIRPFSAKPAQAAFFVREDGAFPRESPRTFLFSRLELGTQTVLAPVLSRDREGAVDAGHATSLTALSHQTLSVEMLPPPARSVEKPARGRRLKWMWIPLSLALLLVGVMGGYQASQTMASWTTARPAARFSLALHVVPIGDNLAVRWDPDAPAVRNARSGLLEIEDAGYSKPVDLDSAHLQSGSVLYRNTSATVRFRLIVYESARVSITETVDWPH
jgi:hypothetical protein